MLFWIILTLFIGAMYSWMGVSIRFFGKTGLISNFIADEKAEKFDQSYARRVGSLSMVGGALCLAAGAAGLWMKPDWEVAAVLLGSVLLSLVLLRVNYVRSDLRRG